MSLVRVEIIHKSKFLPGTVEKNSSTIRSSGRNRTYACGCRCTALLVDEFFSTVPGKDFDLCIISTRTKTHKPCKLTI